MSRSQLTPNKQIEYDSVVPRAMQLEFSYALAWYRLAKHRAETALDAYKPHFEANCKAQRAKVDAILLQFQHHYEKHVLKE